MIVPRAVAESDRFRELVRQGFAVTPNALSSGHLVLTNKKQEMKFFSPSTGEEVSRDEVLAVIRTPATSPSN